MMKKIIAVIVLALCLLTGYALLPSHGTRVPYSQQVSPVTATPPAPVTSSPPMAPEGSDMLTPLPGE